MFEITKERTKNQVLSVMKSFKEDNDRQSAIEHNVTELTTLESVYRSKKKQAVRKEKIRADIQRPHLFLVPNNQEK